VIFGGESRWEEGCFLFNLILDGAASHSWVRGLNLETIKKEQPFSGYKYY